MAPSVSRVTITEATQTPPNMAKKAFLRGRLNTKAARAPVQAPVTGSGTATKNSRASGPYFSI